MIRRRHVVALYTTSLSLAALAVPAAAGAQALTPPPVGTLTTLQGTQRCFTVDGNSSQGTATCGVARGLAGAESVTVSPDGKVVYVDSYSYGSGSEAGISVFSRDPATGALTQLSGTAGCLTTDGASTAGAGTCQIARGLGEPGDGRDLAITPDGRWAYLAAQGDGTSPQDGGGVLIFKRDPNTGALTQLPGTEGCITTLGASQAGSGTCQSDGTLDRPTGVTVSSDGAFVYVTDYGAPYRLHVFARNAQTGALTDVQCLADSPAPGGCTAGRVLGDSQSLAITPNGKYAYSGDFFDGISIFDRNPVTGLLTQKTGTAGCITDNGNDDTSTATCATGRVVGGAYPLSISPDGQTLYVPAYRDDGLSIFHINSDGSLTQLTGTAGCITATGNDQTGAATCGLGPGLDLPYGGTISPDGRSLYVVDDNEEGGVNAFSLDPSTGAATELPGQDGCLTTDGSFDGVSGVCGQAPSLQSAYEVAISPDGSSAYVASYAGESLDVFKREVSPVCSPVNVATVFGTPLSVKLACTDADGQPVSVSVTSGPAHGTLGPVATGTGTVTYTPAAGFAGHDSFTVAASDGTNSSAPAKVSITVVPRPRIALVGGPHGGAGEVTVSVACLALTPARCQGQARLTDRHTSHAASVTVGSEAFNLAPGHQETLVVGLNNTGRRLVALKLRLPVTLTIALSGGAPSSTIRAIATVHPLAPQH
jgi:DNA-binding beta-propeller fold protein YncE